MGASLPLPKGCWDAESQWTQARGFQSGKPKPPPHRAQLMAAGLGGFQGGREKPRRKAGAATSVSDPQVEPPSPDPAGLGSPEVGAGKGG